MKFSACIEWLFADETTDVAERIHCARAAGLDGVEFWFWQNKDIDSIAAALDEIAADRYGCRAEDAPTDPANDGDFQQGMKRSIECARQLGCRLLKAQAGEDLAGRTRREQHRALTHALRQAASALEDTGVTLAIEPLNHSLSIPVIFCRRPRKHPVSLMTWPGPRLGCSMTSIIRM
jgi:hydroxypyruvate isomerase